MLVFLKSRAAIGVGALVIGAAGAGVFSIAIAEGPADTFYACKTSEGKIKPDTIRADTAPTCRTSRGETVVSWTGADGAKSIDDLVGAPCRIGDPAEGTFEVEYARGSGDVSFSCPPTRHLQLTVSKSGTGATWGDVTGDGIDCGDVCTFSYPYGTVVELSTTSAGAAPFDSWSGDCTGATCTVEMTESRHVIAHFDRDATVQIALTMSAGPYEGVDDDGWYVPQGAGAIVTNDAQTSPCVLAPWDGIPINENPSDEDFTELCLLTVPSFSSVTFHVEPDSRLRQEWSGCDSVDGNFCTVIADNNTDVGLYLRHPDFRLDSRWSAEYDLLPCGDVSISTSSGYEWQASGCDVSRDHYDNYHWYHYSPGDTVTFVVTPAQGWVASWTGCTTLVGNTCTWDTDAPAPVLRWSQSP